MEGNSKGIPGALPPEKGLPGDTRELSVPRRGGTVEALTSHGSSATASDGALEPLEM